MEPLSEAPPPLKLTIFGEYWDSQVYSGKLLLFARNKSMHKWNWKQLVTEKLNIPDRLKYIAQAAFLGNRVLYERGARLLLGDPDIRRLVLQKFWLLSQLLGTDGATPAISPSVSANPLPFPHNDSEIHYGRLYVGGRSGVHSFDAEDDTGDGGVRRHSDAVALDLAAKYERIIQAAGSDGLFDVPAGRRSRHFRSPSRITALPTTRCEWTFSSVAASGPDNKLYVAEFRKPARTEPIRSRGSLSFERVIEESELFDDFEPGLSRMTWGARNRFYRFSDGKIDVVRCTAKTNKELQFSNAGSLPPPVIMTGNNVVSARVAPFGSVIELDDCLLILPSYGEPITLPGEPITWRVFPRSREYVNQLHVVYRDRVEIRAFTHDYFVKDQVNKLAGFGISSKRDDEDLS